MKIVNKISRNTWEKAHSETYARLAIDEIKYIDDNIPMINDMLYHIVNNNHCNRRTIGVWNKQDFDEISDVVKAAYYSIGDGNFSGMTLLHWAAQLNKIGPLTTFLNDPACAIDTKCSQGNTRVN